MLFTEEAARELSALVHRTAYLSISNDHDAQDAAQEVLLRRLQGARVEPRTVRNFVRTEWRRIQRHEVPQLSQLGDLELAREHSLQEIARERFRDASRLRALLESARGEWESKLTSCQREAYGLLIGNARSWPLAKHRAWCLASLGRKLAPIVRKRAPCLP